MLKVVSSLPPPPKPRWIPCTFGSLYQVKDRLAALLNALFDENSTKNKDPANRLHFFQILGDNFYDRDGSLSREFYDKLNLGAKAAFSASVPGNHDYWVYGTPILKSTSDQFANGFMQFYAMDVRASFSSTT